MSGDTRNGDLCVIVTAGGASARFGSDKLLAPLGDATVLERSTLAFAGRAGHVVVAVAAPIEVGSELAGVAARIVERSQGTRVDFVVAGGASRAATVRNALAFVGAEWVAVHDGARPLVSGDLIDRVVVAAREHGAAAPALPVALTIKQAGASLPSTVERTVPRSTLWAMQTPQVMRRADLLDAYARCPIPLEQVTDDVQLLELIGHRVMLVPGEERNLKLTTQIDLMFASLLDGRRARGGGS